MEKTPQSLHKSVYLILVDNSELFLNFKKTVKKQINSKILNQFEIPISIRKMNNIGIWGFNSTIENQKLWIKLKKGDVVLLLKNKKYFCSAKIADKSKNLNMAKKLWTGKIYGQNRNLLIFLDDIKKIELDFDSTIPIFVNPTMPESHRFPLIKIDSSKEKMLYKTFGSIDKAINFLSNKIDTDIEHQFEDVKMELSKTISKSRNGQERFHNLVLNNFNTKCALCQISEKDLLQASHIIPVNQKQSMGSIQNGICFCVLHHLMFDRGYFSFDDEYKVILADHKFSSKFLLLSMKQFKKMNKPKKYPSIDFLRLHRARYEMSQSDF